MLTDEQRREFGRRTQVRAASRKHTDWAYENEVRLLSYRWGDFQILKDNLKVIHFIDFTDPLIGDICKICYDRYPGVTFKRWEYDKGIMHFSGYGLKLKTTMLPPQQALILVPIDDTENSKENKNEPPN